MITSDPRSKILFISTFPPAKCGIASFTQDLIRSIVPETRDTFLLNVCALNKNEKADQYKFPVTMVMNSHELDSCIETADKINQDKSIELVCIEHEFGLYGGDMGSFLLGFLIMLEKPFIIRFHTILPTPDANRLKLVQTLAVLAHKIIVMTTNSARLLSEDYFVDADKIKIIPHGTHTNSPVNPDKLKNKYDLKNNLVLTTFGLLSPNKGIEKGILAMKEISAVFPQAIYIVLGLTHPNLLKEEGEKYRLYLQQLIDDNNLQKNVRLVNEYVPTKKLMEYLALTDIYLFTSKDPDQAVSGTFLYAMSAGCAIISNSFVLAKEMLDEKTGVILGTGHEHELAEHAIYLLQNKHIRKQMGLYSFLKTRENAWRNVGLKHSKLFERILKKQIDNADFTKLLIS